VLALTGLAVADQPVHCYKDLVLGKWNFKITRDSALPNLFNSESVCTHELPNKLQIIKKGHKFQFEDPTYDLDVTLSDNNMCTASSSVDTYNDCHWTMMYDQALLIHMP
jgi:hypothetical protein